VRRAKDGNPHSTWQEEQYKYLNSGEENFSGTTEQITQNCLNEIYLLSCK
jgi:hypothetical protein